MSFGGWWMVPVLAMVLFKEETGRIIEAIPNPVWVLYGMVALIVIDTGTSLFRLYVDFLRWRK